MTIPATPTLRDYAQHKSGCTKWGAVWEYPYRLHDELSCSCGLAALLASERQTETPELEALARAMKKVLPPALLAEVLAHLDPLTPFLEQLRSERPETPEKSPEWGLANVYTIARRRLVKLPEGHSEREWWQHVLRIAEQSGVRQPGVLRHSLPTEITEGSGEAGAPPEPWQPIVEQIKAAAKEYLERLNSSEPISACRPVKDRIVTLACKLAAAEASPHLLREPTFNTCPQCGVVQPCLIHHLAHVSKEP